MLKAGVGVYSFTSRRVVLVNDDDEAEVMLEILLEVTLLLPLLILLLSVLLLLLLSVLLLLLLLLLLPVLSLLLLQILQLLAVLESMKMLSSESNLLEDTEVSGSMV